ncbi:Response regulator prrA [Oligella ureolytica]|uniref:Response regulator n=1 Tax=Oligella ureolytica TaxID=90244 RepID=A0A378XHB9_9BURK|nr:response regulator [Oligella ureolytica]QPT41200.1 response regulator [Oligella ureolytica]SUA54063.1 Response regulator prrA [Oligella ureolytica]SUA55194.1 Response regulator prrA [Oligella ureolytica]
MSTEQQYLLIDDNEIFASLMVRGFARHNLLLDWAANSHEALIKENTYAGIILDLNLEQESGMHLLPRLLERYPETNILILTGYASIATAVNAIKIGATNYLPKPATVEQILEAFAGELLEEIKEEAFNTPSLKRMTWEHIQFQLSKNNGNISATARDLGMHRRTLQRMLNKRPAKH